MIRFSCPTCKTILQAAAEQAGTLIACPKCKTQMRLPSPIPQDQPAKTGPPPPSARPGIRPVPGNPEEEWYYAKSGQKVGPVTEADLQGLVRTGQLSRNHMVWMAGLAEWVPAESIKGLFPSTSSAAPVQKSPPSFPKTSIPTPGAVNVPSPGINAAKTAPTAAAPLRPVTLVASEAAEWHYIQNGQQAGPVPWSQLRQIADSGQLRPSDMVWKNGMPTWATAGSIRTLFPHPPALSSPPPPRPSLVAELWPAVTPSIPDTRQVQVPSEPIVATVAAPEETEEKPQGLFGRLFGGKPAEAGLLESYSVVYLGGHPDYPKEKAGSIGFKVFTDRFELSPTFGTKGWFKGLVICFDKTLGLEIVERQVGSLEGMLGGLNSRQLNQRNNIHITYRSDDGKEILLRLEMLSGVTVMGQAKKCQQFLDRMRTHGILAKFQVNPNAGRVPGNVADDIPTQIQKLAALRDTGILTEEEFANKKTDLLSKM